MGALNFWHVLLVLAVVLIFFGPSRLPSLGNSLGRAIRGFKKGLNELDEEFEMDDYEERPARREALPPRRAKPVSPSRVAQDEAQPQQHPEA